jgi:hypothetical protein
VISIARVRQALTPRYITVLDVEEVTFSPTEGDVVTVVTLGAQRAAEAADALNREPDLAATTGLFRDTVHVWEVGRE